MTRICIDRSVFDWATRVLVDVNDRQEAVRPDQPDVVVTEGETYKVIATPFIPTRFCGLTKSVEAVEVAERTKTVVSLENEASLVVEGKRSND